MSPALSLLASLRELLVSLMEVMTFDLSGISMVIRGICLTGQSPVGLAGQLKASLSLVLSQVCRDFSLFISHNFCTHMAVPY